MLIETVVGSLGTGPPVSTGQTPNALAVADGTVYVCDGFWSVIRAIDLASGRQRVVAGTGSPGFRGDGGAATAAQLANPVDVAAGAFGSVVIVDYGNQRIRKVDPTGVITTVAGTGVAGFNGDTQPAVRAQLDTPNGAAMDAAGNIYVADTNNQRVRRIDPSGMIDTIAGTGEPGFAGDGGSARNALLRGPSGVAVSGEGEVFVADSGNHCIRRIDPSGTIVTVAGVGRRGFSGDGGPATAAALASPFAVFVDPDGVLYIPDFGNERVRRVAVDGTISTAVGLGTPGFFGDGGAAVAARLQGPTECATDTLGNLFLVDFGNRRVRRVTSAGGIDTVAGNGTVGYSGDGGRATDAQLVQPAGICLDIRRDLYVADSRNNRIRRVDQHGVITTVAGTGRAAYGGDGEQAFRAQLNRPTGLAVDTTDALFVSDRGNHRIRRIGPDGLISTIAGDGTAGFGGDGGPASAAGLNGPTGVAVGAGGVYFADTLNHRVRRVAPDGTISTVAGDGTPGFGGDGGPAGTARLNTPTALTIGRSGDLYIADSLNHRVRRVSATTGLIGTVAGSGAAGFGGDTGPATQAALSLPAGLGLDSHDDLYIADAGNKRLRRVGTNGTINTVAGDGVPGFGGDDALATGARLQLVATPGDLAGLAADDRGRLYLADLLNHRIRRLRPLGPPARPRGPR